MTLTGIDAAAALLALAYFAKKKLNGAPQAYENGRPVSVTLVPIDDRGHLLEQSAAADFMRMRDAAAAVGISLIVNSAFRSMEEQTALWVAYKNGDRSDVAAPPGYSNHQNGRDVDLETARGTNAAYEWLLINAHLFNFKATVSTEPWHWEHQP